MRSWPRRSVFDSHYAAPHFPFSVWKVHSRSTSFQSLSTSICPNSHSTEIWGPKSYSSALIKITSATSLSQLNSEYAIPASGSKSYHVGSKNYSLAPYYGNFSNDPSAFESSSWIK